MSILSFFAVFLTALFCNAEEFSATPFFSSDYSSSPALKTYGSAFFESGYYPSTIPATPNMNESLTGSLSFILDHSTGRGQSTGVAFENRLDLTWGKYFDWGDTFIKAPDAYTSVTSIEGQATVSLGRRNYLWNSMDQNWNLGEWQPLFAVDPLRTEQVGLTGLFLDKDFGGADVLVFATPVYIPNMNPTVQQRSTAVLADSRWFMQPSQSAVLLGQTTPIQYSLSNVDYGSIVSHPGAGLRVLIGSREDGLWANASYGYKPVNELQVKYNAFLTSQGTSTAEIVPTVAYEHLVGSEIGYTRGTNHYSLSYMADRPDLNDPVNGPYQDFWQQQPSPMWMYGAHADFKIDEQYELGEPTLKLDYLKVFQSVTYDVDSNGIPRMSIFPYRTLYTNALKGTVGLHRRIWGKPTYLEVSGLREFDQEGSVFQILGQVRWDARWNFQAGLDTLSPDDPSVTNLDSRFINKFRANDRVYAGARYAF
jgi:hypothetical protein